MDNQTFTRDFEIETVATNLTLHQQQVGDVSCVVWDAALVLAKYLDGLCRREGFGRDWLKGKRVVELGAGVGCVGITAACLGADVVLTDLESTMPILRKNITENENHWKNVGTVTARVLDWVQDIDEDLIPDIVLLADCVYYTKSIEPLINTIHTLCSRQPSTYALLSQEERDTPGQIPVWREFLSQLSNKFHLRYIPLSEQHPTYSSEDIHLIELKIRS